MASVQAAPTPTQSVGMVPQAQVSQQEFKEALQVSLYILHLSIDLCLFRQD